MQTNDMSFLERETRKKIREVFGDKVDTITAYDIVDEPNHHMFKLNFIAYDYVGIQCSYENDLFGMSIVLNDQFAVSLSDEKHGYSDISDWNSYLRDIMAKIELRIPDKFLKSRGWL